MSLGEHAAVAGCSAGVAFADRQTAERCRALRVWTLILEEDLAESGDVQGSLSDTVSAKATSTLLPSGAELLPTGKNYGRMIFCNRYSYRYRKIF
eukprot:625203-Amphidinium_carterae.1